MRRGEGLNDLQRARLDALIKKAETQQLDQFDQGALDLLLWTATGADEVRAEQLVAKVGGR